MSEITRKKHTGQVGNGGEFGSKPHTESNVDLTASQTSMNIFDHSGVGTETVDRFPKNVTEARAALRNTRGEPNGGIRAVYLDSSNCPDDPEVHGPADGRPLLITVFSGMVRLNILSGNVIVSSGSSWGNAVKTGGDATATVIALDGKKVSVNADDNSRITIIPGEGAHGLACERSDAQVTIVDTDWEHRMHVIHPTDR